MLKTADCRLFQLTDAIAKKRINAIVDELALDGLIDESDAPMLRHRLTEDVDIAVHAAMTRPIA